MVGSFLVSAGALRPGEVPGFCSMMQHQRSGAYCSEIAESTSLRAASLLRKKSAGTGANGTLSREHVGVIGLAYAARAHCVASGLAAFLQ